MTALEAWLLMAIGRIGRFIVTNSEELSRSLLLPVVYATVPFPLAWLAMGRSRELATAVSGSFLAGGLRSRVMTRQWRRSPRLWRSFRSMDLPRSDRSYSWLVTLRRPRLADLVRLGEAWRLDVETAVSDLEATRTQANVLAAYALAWRVTAVLLPVSLGIAALAVLVADEPPWLFVLSGVGAVFAPQAAAFVLTWPLDFWGSVQTWFRGSREARLRYGITNLVYPYYGWRYAFAGRTRQWGALTHQEREARDPGRAGVTTAPPPRRNYWPE